MGKRKDGVNPAEAARKKDAERRKKANAEARRAAREAALKKASVQDIKEEIERLQRIEAMGPGVGGDPHAADKRKRLEKELEAAKAREKERAARKAEPQQQVNIKGLNKIFKSATPGAEGKGSGEEGGSGDSDDSSSDDDGESADPYQARLQRREADSGAYVYDDQYRSSLPLALLPGAGSKEKWKAIKRGEALDPVLEAQRLAEEAAKTPSNKRPAHAAAAQEESDELPPAPAEPPGLKKPPEGWKMPDFPFGQGLEQEEEDVVVEPVKQQQQQQQAAAAFAPGPTAPVPPVPYMPYAAAAAPHMHSYGAPPPMPMPYPSAGGAPYAPHPGLPPPVPPMPAAFPSPSPGMPPPPPQPPRQPEHFDRGGGFPRGPAPRGGGGGGDGGGYYREPKERFELDPMDPNPESAHEAWLEEREGAARKRFKGPGGAARPAPQVSDEPTAAPAGPTVTPKPAAAAASAPVADGRPKQATIKPSFTPTNLLVRNRPAPAPAPMPKPRSVQINAAPDVDQPSAPPAAPATATRAPPPPPPRQTQQQQPVSTAAAYNDFMKEMEALGAV